MRFLLVAFLHSAVAAPLKPGSERVLDASYAGDLTRPNFDYQRLYSASEKLHALGNMTTAMALYEEDVFDERTVREQAVFERSITDAFVANFAPPDMAAVEGATLSKDQLAEIIEYLIKERSLTKQTACYRKTYDRGIGKVKNQCSGGDVFRTDKCVKPCVQTPYKMGDGGYSRYCTQKECPEGYSNFGQFNCKFNGKHKAGTLGSYKVKCGKKGKCTKKGYKKVLCSCKYQGTCAQKYGSKYSKNVLRTCYYNYIPPKMKKGPLGAIAPLKQVYWREKNSDATCHPDRPVFEGFPVPKMCYKQPRDNFECWNTHCVEKCLDQDKPNGGEGVLGSSGDKGFWDNTDGGMMKCGAGMCVQNGLGCLSNIASMVMSPAMLAANIVSFGGASAATGGAKVGAAAEKLSKMDKLKEMLSKPVTLFEVGKYIATKVAPATYDAAQDAMTGATEDLAQISSAHAANEIIKYFPIGTPNYNYIAKNMGFTTMILGVVELIADLAKGAAEAFDPTGVVGVISAFAFKMCRPHFDSDFMAAFLTAEEKAACCAAGTEACC